MCRKIFPLLFSVISVSSVVEKPCYRIHEKLHFLL